MGELAPDILHAGHRPPAGGVAAGCCAAGAVALAAASDPETTYRNFISADPEAFVTEDADGNALLHLLVENMHCAACIRTIEKSLAAHPAVLEGRVNFSTRRLLIRWDSSKAGAAELVRPIMAAGYGLTPYDANMMLSARGQEDTRLLKALAVAGFAAMNVMLLSVSVWAGLFSNDMGPSTRDFLHWISALIAMPAVAYSGRVFFHSALAALRAGRLNMDVPISLAVILAVGMSLAETIQGGEYAYFDAAVTLLFFLLIGRYLDNRARTRARSAAERLLMLKAVAATVIDGDGTRHAVPVDAVTPGTRVCVALGDRFPVDGEILQGRTDVDNSLVTGESLPLAASEGTPVYAGTLNLTAPVIVRATKTGDNTLLGDIVRLMENAEQGRARYVLLADRIAEYYAPAVHILAAITFAGWWLTGHDWQLSLLQAVAVLIVTCPCALGLAVPVVQVVASGRLLDRGILVKAADGLERLARVDTVVFDKTGTLTEGRPDLLNGRDIRSADVQLAASMAQSSRHPLAVAVARACPSAPGRDGVTEHPGLGLSISTPDGEIRLGSRDWCGIAPAAGSDQTTGPELWLRRPGHDGVQFRFHDALRNDAAETVAQLQQRGIHVELLSGDRAEVVAHVAAAAGIKNWHADTRPAGKVDHLTALKARGHTVLMVGDGLNDAPALAAAHVSLSPATAADISQTVADFIFQGRSLSAVVEVLDVARTSHRLVVQNFALAFLYNAIAVPLAVLGFVTPLVAAIAMSASSLMVCGNSMRLKIRQRQDRPS